LCAEAGRRFRRGRRWSKALGRQSRPRCYRAMIDSRLLVEIAASGLQSPSSCGRHAACRARCGGLVRTHEITLADG
jgi:hypothetical protein